MLKNRYVAPLKTAFQFEYSLYEQISLLFAWTFCRSMVADRLYLYYREAPNARDSKSGDMTEKPCDITITKLIQRDVLEHITFPMMSECFADVHIRTMTSGLHEFTFTDDIYTFSVSLRMDRACKKVLGINVTSSHVETLERV